MPNWCDNLIIISSDDKEKIKPIYDFFTQCEKKVEELNQIRRDAITSGKSREDVLREHPYPDMLVMNTLVPRDEDYERIVEEHDYLLAPQSTFYGTKWDFQYLDANVSINSDTEIVINPLTAWSPCDKFCERLSAKYGVDVSIQYEEPGNAFIGRAEYSNGVLTETEHYEDTPTKNEYMKGLYNLDIDAFFSRVESQIETFIEENPDGTAIQYIEREIPFIPEELVMEVEEIFNQNKENA